MKARPLIPVAHRLAPGHSFFSVSRRRLSLAARILALLVPLDFAAAAGAESAAQPNYFDRTVYVHTEVLPNRPYADDRKTDTHSASGFFVEHQGHYLFVTAKHVALETTPDTEFCFLTPAGDSHYARLVGLVADTTHPWHMHPGTDLAIFPVTFSSKLEKGITEEIRALAIPFSALSSNEVIRASRVTVCGFPIELGTWKKISPLAMTAYVASREMEVPMEGGSTSMFLITPAIGAGCSGGPVFSTTDRGEAEAVLGIYVSTYFDSSGGKLSSVVPARQIAELITEVVGDRKEKP
ncbi:hypothetical protein CfE428DRAFT_1252 [Chthoniobacter flavus Ellin428]|uniref:Serine protease n=1 Tax=Chthoniobacter flavus Ellin428 TaxID=497964 RepID=B4CXG1_9BACT|nr:serine protease [Chthoniobacter flavus]EDY20959.1 hypothetical protein CfE428DRAFT_1252 [Chthoniobacter flavus Ellin428]TCO88688.1 trypsin-like peptidase [Chthoniobacter flavus]